MVNVVDLSGFVYAGGQRGNVSTRETQGKGSSLTEGKGEGSVGRVLINCDGGVGEAPFEEEELGPEGYVLCSGRTRKRPYFFALR